MGGNDTVFGNEGGDTIYGGGDNVLTGGANQDTFIFNSVNAAAAFGPDTILL